MKKYKVMMVEFSVIGDDGSRKTLGKTEIASCKLKGDAENIAKLLRENTYSWINKPEHNSDNSHVFRIVVEQ